MKCRSRVLKRAAAWAVLCMAGAGLTACSRDEKAEAPPVSEAAASAAALPAAREASAGPMISPDGIALADPQAGAVREASSAKAWGGARTGQEATLSDRVVSYQIEAKLDPVAHTLEGKQKTTWRNRSDREVRSIYLHLYLNAFEGEGSTFMSEKRLKGFEFRSDVPVKDGDWGHIKLNKVQQAGADVPWQFVQPDGGPTTDHTVVRLDLPQAVPAGSSTTLDIDFFDKLPRVMARTGYFGTFHLVGQWFPKVGVLELPGERGATAPRWNVHEFHLHSEFYADFGSYDVTINVPEGYTVGATGEEMGPPVKKDGRSIHRFVQGDVHDFAWTADSRSGKPLEADWSGPGSPPVKVKVLYPPEYAATAPAVLKATKDALTWFSETLGPYPYKTVTAVIPPFNATEAGGMEYPTFFTASGMAKAEPGTVAEYALDFVTIHEFGHGYFYGLLASNEFEEPYLDEGMNEFWDQRMMRARNQDLHLSTPLLKKLGVGAKVKVFDMERATAGLVDPPDALGHSSWHRFSSSSYGTVYARTATLMHDIETQIGKDKLEQAFKTYYQRWKFRHPSTADLREVLAEVSGQPALINKLFDQHVYASNKVDDRIESFKSVEELPLLSSALSEKQRDEQVEQARKAWKKAHPDAKAEQGGAFPYRTTVMLRRRGAAQAQTLVVKFADGSSETVVWDDEERWKRVSWVKPAKAVSAQLDPEQQHSLDVSLADNGQRLKPDGRAARRLATDAGGLVQTLLALIATL